MTTATDPGAGARAAEEELDGKPMTFWEHLEELRKRLIRCLLVFFVAWLWSASARSTTQSKCAHVTPIAVRPDGSWNRLLSASSSAARSASAASPIAAFSRSSLSPRQ